VLWRFPKIRGDGFDRCVLSWAVSPWSGFGRDIREIGMIAILVLVDMVQHGSAVCDRCSASSCWSKHR
jgi:hypothetical protein